MKRQVPFQWTLVCRRRESQSVSSERRFLPPNSKLTPSAGSRCEASFGELQPLQGEQRGK